MTEETNNIENHSVGGSVAVGRDVTVGGRSTVRGNATFNRDVYISGWLNARNIRGAGKGLYETVDKLNSAYPNPENGWFALVGDTLPADIYRAWGGEWVATGKKGGEPVLELAKLTELSESLENEVSARVAADEALKNAIDAEVTARANGDKELSDALTKEIANRLKELSGWKITENEQYMFLITDSANNLLFGINRKGEMECDKGMSREVRERLDELRGWQVKRNEQFVFLVTDKKQNLLLGIRRDNGRLVVPHGFIEVVTEKEYEETEIENDVLYAIKGKGGRIVDLCLNGQPIRNSEEHFFSKEDNILMYNGHMTVMPRIYIDHDEMMLMVEYPTGYEGPLFENVDGMLFVRN